MTDTPTAAIKPIAYCADEGGNIYPWLECKGVSISDDVSRHPPRMHAVFFDDGSRFDTVNGLHKIRPEETLAHVVRCLAALHLGGEPAPIDPSTPFLTTDIMRHPTPAAA